jgi:hypothetical protein
MARPSLIGLALTVLVLSGPAVAQTTVPHSPGPSIPVFGLERLRWSMPVSDVKAVFPNAVERPNRSSPDDTVLKPDLVFEGCRFTATIIFLNGRLGMMDIQRVYGDSCSLDIGAYLTKALGARQPSSSKISSDWDDGHLVVQYLHNNVPIDDGLGHPPGL